MSGRTHTEIEHAAIHTVKLNETRTLRHCAICYKKGEAHVAQIPAQDPIEDSRSGHDQKDHPHGGAGVLSESERSV